MGIKIGNAQGFWGDKCDAAKQLIQAVQLDYLTLDYLAEVSLSIMAVQREKNPSLGYARDFLQVIEDLLPFWKEGKRFKLVSNAGGLNPLACGKACRKILSETPLKIAVILGDDVKEKVEPGYLTANAYIGAHPIKEALLEGADIIIGGRIADPSLTVGPCMAEFGWQDDFDAIAGGTLAGHVIECGTQATGGIATHWLELPDPSRLGYPVVEVESDGSFVLSQSADGGEVSQRTVKEQLLYEIGDPSCYLSPDATVSLMDVEIETVGKNCVRVFGAKGSPPPRTLKINATKREGYRAEGTLLVVGHNAVIKAKKAADVVKSRLKDKGLLPHQFHIECLGTGDSVPGLARRDDLLETVLRIAVSDPQRAPIEAFSKEIAPLVTSGPPGTTGYTSGRPKIRPVFGFHALEIPREHVSLQIESMDDEIPARHCPREKWR